jgi:DNA-binding GntR family transcriptional regulator
MVTKQSRAAGAASGARAEGSGFAPVPLMDRRSSGELVAVHIRTLIFNGELRQGDRVRQDEIAEQLGVSRIPVREAIIALDREGWLEITPHRGAFVHGLDEDSLRDHYELLGLVYGLAARRAVERGTVEAVEQLAVAQAAFAAAASPDQLHDTNDVFLRTLLNLARAPRLGSVMRGMATVAPGNFFELVPGSDVVQQQGTAAIVAAVTARDPERAAAACVELLRSQGELVIALLASRGMFRTEDAVGQ